MIGEVTPGLILILGGLLSALVPQGRLRAGFMLALPLVAAVQLLSLTPGEHGQLQLFGLDLTTLRVDALSLPFGYIFLIATVLCVVYALHLRDTVQQVTGLVYAGGALGAVFAGDLLTLLVFWETIALASVFLILARRQDSAYRAAVRYLLVQLASGLLLMAGVLMHVHATGRIQVQGAEGQRAGGLLIFLGFGVKAAFPLLHGWLQDAYPEATVTGTVFLSAFTTKVAIYALARGFAGAEILVPIGLAMTAFPIFYAVIENDLRRVLAYSLINQLGFMVIGIGIGTELALNGAVAHAFADILFKGLLFMTMGAVLYRVGTIKGSELGGLYKSMPWTTGFCIVGAASISAFPLFSGFVTKSMIIAAAMEQDRFIAWLIMLFASAGVFHHAGIKIPYFAFFAHDSGKRCSEAPAHMLVAMGASAVLCVAIGVLPGAFYSLLPYGPIYQPYTLEHVVTQLQLLFLSALAFTVLMRTGIYPPELPSTNLDIDWLYRRFGWRALMSARYGATQGWRNFAAAFAGASIWIAQQVGLHSRPGRLLAGGPWPTGVMVFWTTLMLAAYLAFFYLR
jgi:multicomponent Na+:H+ antiporter subunit D